MRSDARRQSNQEVSCETSDSGTTTLKVSSKGSRPSSTRACRRVRSGQKMVQRGGSLAGSYQGQGQPCQRAQLSI